MPININRVIKIKPDFILKGKEHENNFNIEDNLIKDYEETLKSFKEDQNNTNKSINQKLNALSEKVNEWKNLASNSFSRSRSDNRDKENNKNKDKLKNGDSAKPYLGVCFGCNIQGHSFYDCRKISPEKRDEIKTNFSTYLARSRADRLKNLNSGLQRANSYPSR